MNPLQRITEMLEDAEALNEEVRGSLADIKLSDAQTIIERCRETEGWLKGVRKILMG